MSFTPGFRITTILRPRYEGCNICTWIGFKHVNYLVEEATLALFRRAGFGPGALYEQYGLGLDIIKMSTRILKALHIDDEVRADVEVKSLAARAELTVTLTVNQTKAVTSKVSVALVRDQRLSGETRPIPVVLQSFATDTCRSSDPHAVALAEQPSEGGRSAIADIPTVLQQATGRGVAWRWRVPYFYCHYVTRLQMSGLLRNMEEIVDLFLVHRGASIRTMLDTDDLIPVVPSSEIELYDEVEMAEEILTVFEVETVFKGTVYTARMDTYALREGKAVLVSSGRITHGYAHIDSRRDWSMVEFNEALLRAVS